MSKITEDKKLEYAWNWFSYHATQRVTAFRLFLVVLGILLFGVQNGLEAEQFSLVRLIGVVGIAVSIMFLILDWRNTKLVETGKTALQRLEEDFSTELQASQGERSKVFNHSVIFRSFFGLCIVMFLVVLVCPEWLHGGKFGS